MNHITASFHAGHKTKRRLLWTKLAFVMGEVSKCHGEGWRESIKRQTHRVPQCSQGLRLHHTPAVPAKGQDMKSREGLGPAAFQQEFNRAVGSHCCWGEKHKDDQSCSVLWMLDSRMKSVFLKSFLPGADFFPSLPVTEVPPAHRQHNNTPKQ